MRDDRSTVEKWVCVFIGSAYRWVLWIVFDEVFTKSL